MKERIDDLQRQIDELKSAVEELTKFVAILKDQNEILRKGINTVGKRVVSLENSEQVNGKDPLFNPKDVVGDPKSASWLNDLFSGLGKK